MPRWIFALIQFIPLSLFATYAFWNGAPDEHRWEIAFKLASIAALIQLVIILPQSRPANRLVLAANFYLLLGGLAFLTHQWWYLRLYDSLRETAIFVLMMVVGTITTLASRAGYVGAENASERLVIRASLALLLATAIALVLSVLFRGDRYLAAVWPIVGLAVLQRFLAHGATRLSSPVTPNNSIPPNPPRASA